MKNLLTKEAVIGYLTAPRMSAKERAFFAKRLSFLVRSGMGLAPAIGLLEAQARSKSVRSALGQVKTAIESGTSFSESALPFWGLFGPFSLQIISVGEASGTLSENLSYLADELEKKALLRSKLLGALIYPALITIATIVLTISLILFIFPKILPIFSGLGVALPWPTRFLLGVNAYLRAWGALTLFLLVASAIACVIAVKRYERLRDRLERLTLMLPIFGPMLQAYHLGNLNRTLAILLKSGMVLREALVSAANTTDHSLYRRELERIAVAVEEGGDLGGYMREQRALFPDLVAQMVAVGESSGSLPETLAYLAHFYENELEESTKSLSALVVAARIELVSFPESFDASLRVFANSLIGWDGLPGTCLLW